MFNTVDEFRQWASSHEDRFKYMLLDRMRMDCDYFLGNGNGFAGHLWAGDADRQCDFMTVLHELVPEKPEWLSREQIDSYRRRMSEFKPVKRSIFYGAA